MQSLAEEYSDIVTNWAGNQWCRPRSFTYPETVEELQNSIGEAARQGLRVRVIGGGHSWSDAAMSNDWLVSLDRLNRVINVDKAARTVTVEAGIRLKDLNRALTNTALLSAI